LDALETCGINGERRAETLSVDEFIALGRVLSSASAHQPG
jgi:16S rRNA A1518/A1519 N6-dimethyltransferase RsmA/KsgA/DIM1 with predicted DNA glycosylase/AP lyase activity